ncbi:MAG: GNAT family N-acetyltransferase [Alphaproteobacteria bacterium]|nr:GNAT family N-acetyltransferase [Alphaproteobacteria bacterium]
MKVVVLHDAIPADAPPDAIDTLDMVEAVEGALVDLGHAVERLALDADLGAGKQALGRLAPDLVFNLVEAVAGDGRFIAAGAQLCESLGLPFTGCNADALYLTSNKPLSKAMLRRAGIPTPDWSEPGAVPAAESSGPWIVKSVWEPGSVGLGPDAIVDDPARIAPILAERRRRHGGQWYVERAIAGREFNQLLVEGPAGPEAYPLGEVLFLGWPADRPQILDYDAKWDDSRGGFFTTPRSLAACPGEAGLRGEMESLARACWGLFGLTGCARVDFRVDAAGRPFVLDVNSNPCLTPEVGLIAALGARGETYQRYIGRLVEAATRPARPARAKPAASPAPEPVWRDGSQPEDVAAVRAICASTGFFSAEEIAMVGAMVEDKLAEGEDCEWTFLYAMEGGETVAFACYGRVPLTLASWDLFWIAARADRRGGGLGRAVLDRVESLIAAAGGRQVIVETASRKQYDPTRAFYRAAGYAEKARLADFYAPDDDKVVFVKRLNQG